MDHRHVVYSSQVPDIVDHAHIHTYSNCPSMSFENPAPSISTGLRAMDYRPSSYNTQLANINMSNSGISHDINVHDSYAGSSGRFFTDYTQFSHGSIHLIGNDESSASNPNLSNGMGAFKRKNPTNMVFEGVHAHGYHDSPNNFNNPIFIDPIGAHLQGPQFRSPNPIHIAQIDNRSLNAHAVSGGFQRNVRGRWNPGCRFGNSSDRQTGNSPHFVNLSGSTYGVAMVGHNFPVPESVVPGHCFTDHEGGLQFVENRVASGHANIQNSTPIVPLTFSAPSMRATGPGCSSYNPRAVPHRAASSCPRLGSRSNFLQGRTHSGLSGVQPMISSRPSRPLAIVDHNHLRNSGGRNCNDRVQASVNGHNRSIRWPSEAFLLINSAPYYSMDAFDQHSNLRLDIDNMSYEDLLALEESMGNVSTGLHEDSISRCLIEMPYRSSGPVPNDQDEAKCAICLETYREGENLGILKCEHEFHTNCIAKWLSIKNACPVCKAAALSDASREKQAVDL